MQYINGQQVSAKAAQDHWLTHCLMAGWDLEEARAIWVRAIHPDGEEARDIMIEAGIEITH